MSGDTSCGGWSRPQTVEVPPGLVQAVPDFGQAQPFSGLGPDEVASGVYSSTVTDYNAWHFNWANRLRFPQLANTFPSEHLDLAIRWQTYEYSSTAGRTVPIWLWAQLELQDGAGSVWSGPLYYRTRTNGQFVSQNVGQIEVTPSAGSAAPDARVMGIRWRADRSAMYGGGQSPNTWVADTLTYSDVAGVPGTNRLPHDSYSGDWTDDPLQPPDQDVSLLFWIENQVERIDLLFQNASGEPVWALTTRTASPTSPITAGMEGFCAYTVFDGPLPNQPASTSPTVEYLGCGASGQNLGRLFDPVEPGPPPERESSGPISSCQATSRDRCSTDRR